MRFNTGKMQDRMKELDISQSDLAKRLGVSRQTVFNWLEGKILKFQTLERLAKALALKESELITED